MLGEEVGTAAEAAEIAEVYRAVLARIDADALDANVSVKLTGLGLELDQALCRANLAAVVDDAGARGNFVRIDMEDSSTTDAALRLYRELRAGGRENVGVVLQASLRRTLADVPGLANVRLCKGIYVEPLSRRLPRSRRDPRQLPGDARRALRRGRLRRHRDPRRGADRRGAARGSPPAASLATRSSSRCCSACGPSAATSSSRAGHRLRVYVPFGTHWYEYSIRRLQENPKLAGYVAIDTLRRLRVPL